MFSRDSRPTRRGVRDGRRPELAALVESLEGRQLLAYSPLGFALPDLSVSGFGPSVAAWGQPISVTVNVANTSASSTLDPLSMAPGSASTADAPASTVAVFALKSPHSLAGAVKVGTIDIPAVVQNNSTQVTGTVTLPNRPTGFPGSGGSIYLAFRANDGNAFIESDFANNSSRPVRVKIEAPFPQLSVVGLDGPPVMQPGDAIQPNIRVANLGTVDTANQGPVTIALVASTSRNFNSGSSIVALYTVSNIPAQSLAPSKGVVLGDANLNPNVNIVTIAGDPVRLPTSPDRYFLGVVVDPYNKLKQLKDLPQNHRGSGRDLELTRTVGPPIRGLIAAGQVQTGGVLNVPVFPFPYNGLPPGGDFNGTFPAPLATATNAANGLNPDGSLVPAPILFGSGTISGASRQRTYAALKGPARPATNFAGLSAAKGTAVANTALGRSSNG